jgi:Guanine nucleotide exchange factor in Golgi transport N-terminal
VSSTAAATLRQLVMFVVDKVVEEDRRILLASELEPITLPDGTTRSLGPAARDAFAIFEDLCLLGNDERPQFLQLEHLHKTFALELIESVLTNYHELFHKARVSSSTHIHPPILI